MRDPVQRNVPPRPGGGGGEAAGPGRKAEQSGATGTMSIGEVLGILKPEFPDITVSKIRFLEGAGLVQPDRSASGYRKFSEDDVARLRFVLRAQRDQYLPLRVIRQRLADLEQVGGLDAKGAQVPSTRRPSLDQAHGPGRGARVAGTRGRGVAWARRGGAGTPERPGPGRPEPPGPGPAEPGPGRRGRGGGDGCAGREPGRTGDGRGVRGRAAVRRPVHPRRALPGRRRHRGAAPGAGVVRPGQRPRQRRAGAWYGGDDLVLLRLARELADYGLEARHLRMYKLFAEREAALFEQVVAPLVRQRNPEARTRARDTIEALAQLGGRMRDLALRSAVHGLADTRDPHR